MSLLLNFRQEPNATLMQLLTVPLCFFPSTSASVIAEFLNFPSDYYSVQLFMYIINGQRNSGNYDKCSRSEHLSLPTQRTYKTNLKVYYFVKVWLVL